MHAWAVWRGRVPKRVCGWAIPRPPPPPPMATAALPLLLALQGGTSARVGQSAKCVVWGSEGWSRVVWEGKGKWGGSPLSSSSPFPTHVAVAGLGEEDAR